jgi:hypothetical protein
VGALASLGLAAGLCPANLVDRTIEHGLASLEKVTVTDLGRCETLIGLARMPEVLADTVLLNRVIAGIDQLAADLDELGVSDRVPCAARLQEAAMLTGHAVGYSSETINSLASVVAGGGVPVELELDPHALALSTRTLRALGAAPLPVERAYFETLRPVDALDVLLALDTEADTAIDAAIVASTANISESPTGRDVLARGILEHSDRACQLTGVVHYLSDLGADSTSSTDGTTSVVTLVREQLARDKCGVASPTTLEELTDTVSAMSMPAAANSVSDLLRTWEIATARCLLGQAESVDLSRAGVLMASFGGVLDPETRALSIAGTYALADLASNGNDGCSTPD